MTHARFLVFLVIVAMFLSTPGCAGASRVALKGKVTLDGVAVGPGRIAFLPQPGTVSTKAAAEIIDGQYEVRADRVPSPGTFRVEINWSKRTGKQIPSADPGIMTEETVEVIPAMYNSESTLTVEIKPGENIHDFPLKSR